MSTGSMMVSASFEALENSGRSTDVWTVPDGEVWYLAESFSYRITGESENIGSATELSTEMVCTGPKGSFVNLTFGSMTSTADGSDSSATLISNTTIGRYLYPGMTIRARVTNDESDSSLEHEHTAILRRIV